MTDFPSSYPERHLQVLPSPDVHPLVVGPDLVEVVPVDGEEAAGHGGGAEGLGAVAVATVHLALGDAVPEFIQWYS